MIGRKGMGEMIDWVWPMAFMVIAVVAIAFLVRYYADRGVDAADLEFSAYGARLLYDDILMYRDPGGRVYAGVIDASKLTPDRLDRTFAERRPGGIGRMASKVEIAGGEGCTIPNRVIYNDRQTFEQFLPFASNRVRGPGSATLRTEVVPVVIRAGKDCAATMTVTMVRPNS